MKNYIKIIFLIFLISILIFDDVLSYKIKSKSNIKDSNSSEDKQKRSEKNNLIKILTII